jgi:Phosphatidylinositol 3- and 4-kinase
MLLPAGNLFHIDFGYIFGRDPKPMAPPFRFTREMADGMLHDIHTTCMEYTALFDMSLKHTRSIPLKSTVSRSLECVSGHVVDFA